MQNMNLTPNIVLEFFKFKTSGNLISLEPIPGNANQK